MGLDPKPSTLDPGSLLFKCLGSGGWDGALQRTEGMEGAV